MLAYFWGLPFFIRVVLGLVVAIGLLIILVRFRNGKGSAKDSLTILREKLQRGEISEEDYKRARKNAGNRKDESLVWKWVCFFKQPKSKERMLFIFLRQA